MRGSLIVRQETFADIWPECHALGQEHFAEVEGELVRNRPYCLDAGLMSQLCKAGVLKIIAARRGHRLVGYCTWQLTMDVESAGLLIAHQGAWFVSNEGQGAGLPMFREARRVLHSLGVKWMFPHYRLRGRGRRLGAWLERLGAPATQVTHALWIGEAADA